METHEPSSPVQPGDPAIDFLLMEQLPGGMSEIKTAAAEAVVCEMGRVLLSSLLEICIRQVQLRPVASSVIRWVPGMVSKKKTLVISNV